MPLKANQTPEQAAREVIDPVLRDADWGVQDNRKIDFSAGPRVAVREYETDPGPADYVLTAGKKPVGVSDERPDHRCHNITAAQEQSAECTSAGLKWVNNCGPLAFVYEVTGVLTRFTDMGDAKPSSREVFSWS